MILRYCIYDMLGLFADDFFLYAFEGRVGLPLQLEKQTFLKVSGSDTCRVELLNDFKNPLHFFGVGIYAPIKHEFIHQCIHALTENTVFIQGTDQVFGNVVVFLVELLHGQLLLQNFIEWDGVGKRNFFRCFSWCRDYNIAYFAVIYLIDLSIRFPNNACYYFVIGGVKLSIKNKWCTIRGNISFW